MDYLGLVPPEKDYYILLFPYGNIVFYGTAAEAKHRYEWLKGLEGRGGIRLADPDNAQDCKLIMAEIEAAKKDRAAGNREIPYLPTKFYFETP